MAGPERAGVPVRDLTRNVDGLHRLAEEVVREPIGTALPELLRRIGEDGAP
ncbi:hypothetical protein [Streptomyces triticiradicis]|uniref:hypothetical protein n=1 Tax=Streptomyces triticiradicis TaxID=2651189 RepID=UPI001CEC40D7|nr:hypothetical protein [Streptomyces triticiradicis]